jgi:hypothetical protein
LPASQTWTASPFACAASTKSFVGTSIPWKNVGGWSAWCCGFGAPGAGPADEPKNAAVVRRPAAVWIAGAASLKRSVALSENDTTIVSPSRPYSFSRPARTSAAS